MERPGSKGAPRDVDEYELAWVAAHLPQLRAWVAGPRILYTTLAISLVLGLATHIAGYLLRLTVSGEPLGLIADLLASLGMALWTGVVLVVFVQILPEARRRAAVRTLEAYETALRARTRGRGRARTHGRRATRRVRSPPRPTLT